MIRLALLGDRLVGNFTESHVDVLLRTGVASLAWLVRLVGSQYQAWQIITAINGGPWTKRTCPNPVHLENY